MPDGTSATILVVEDDDAMRDLLAEELRDAGHRVLSAPGGSLGLDVARAEPVDLVVTDPSATQEMKALAASQLRSRSVDLDERTEQAVVKLVGSPEDGTGGAGYGGVAYHRHYDDDVYY